MNDSSDLKDLARARALASSGVARTVRVAAQVSLAEVGRALGVQPSTVLRWETAQRSPSAEYASPYLRLIEDLMQR